MSKRTIWALVAVAIILAVILAAYGLPPQEICEPAKQVGQEQCTAYRFPLFLAIQVGEFLDLHNGLIIAAFTGTLWWSTHRLWKASTKQLRHSEDTAQRQLRAYLDFDGVRIGRFPQKDMPGADKPLAIRSFVRLHNYGKTPADDLKVGTTEYLRIRGKRIQYTAGDTIDFGSVAPTDHITYRGVWHMTEERWGAIEKHEITVIICVNVTYTDAFKNPHELSSDFELVNLKEDFGFVEGTRKSD